MAIFQKKEKPDFEITQGLILRREAAFDTEPRFRTLLLKGFIVYLVVMGSMGCLLSSFTIPYDAPVLHLAVLAGSLFSAFLYYTKVWENLGYFLLFALMLGTALILRRYISSGFFAVVNIISERAAYYFDTEVVQGYAESIGNRSVTVTIAFVYVGWVHAILLNALISRQMKYFAVMFASFFFLTVPFYLEREPDMLYILMLMAGCAIVFVFRGARHTPITKNDQKYEYIHKKRHINYVYSFRHHLTMVLMLCVLVALVGGVFQLFVDKHDFETSNRGRSAWKEGTHDTVANIYKNGIWGLFNRYDSTGGLRGGVLGGVNSVSLDYETDLEVTYVPYSADRVYLRSFTGAEYVPYSNRWQRPVKMVMEPENLSEEKGKILVTSEPLPEATTSVTAKLLKERFEKGVPSSAKGRMDVKNVAAGLGTFLPYYVDEENINGLQMMSYRNVYSLTYYPWITDPGAVTEEEEKKLAKDEKNDTAKDPAESALDAVQVEVDRYLYEGVPEDNMAVIDEFIKEAGLEPYRRHDEKDAGAGKSGKDAAGAQKKDAGTVSAQTGEDAEAQKKDAGTVPAQTEEDAGAIEAIQALGKYFQDNIPYSYQPGVTPRNKDFVNYFLSDNKKGYCAHFASAATLILRRLGYRARYVEGYAIDPSDLAENGQRHPELKVSDYYEGAKELKQESSVVKVRVTDANAHAWVEVEIGGHWRIAELTPWSDEEAPGKGFLQNLIDFLAGTTSSGSSSSGEEVTGEMPGGMGLDSIGKILGYGLLAVAAVAAFAALLFFLSRLLRGRLRYLRAGRSDRLVMNFHRISRRADRLVAKHSADGEESSEGEKAEQRTINYRERILAMEKAGQLSIRDEEREELVHILEKAGFSGQEISKEMFDRAGELLSKKTAKGG